MKFSMRRSGFRISMYLTLLAGLPGMLSAREGMWLPAMIQAREADMKNMGLRIPVSELYNDQGTGLNQAVVFFGRGCTGEVISGEGLVLTNHHCGYGTVQGLSSMEKDYFANGFWAGNKGEEIPCPGLTVTFVRRMENITAHIVDGLPDTLSAARRDEVISGRIATWTRVFGAGTEVSVQPFYAGNEYWAIYTETYRDIRLVGFPPNGIGAFGGDTDNWMWPRHTGDFAIFRIYAGSNNEPADYAATNKPYKPVRFFTINAGGYKEGDFTMVYGFPGQTRQYITSTELEQTYSLINPIRIEARTRKLNVWNERSQASRDVFLKYTSKKARVANGWKKWQGEQRGLAINNVTAKKMAYESGFQAWASRATSPREAAGILPLIDAVSGHAESAIRGNEYIREIPMAVEAIAQGAQLDVLLELMRKGISSENPDQKWNNAVAGWDGYFRNYDQETDRQLFGEMMELYFEKAPEWVPESFRNTYQVYDGDLGKWSAHVFDFSLAASEGRFRKFIEHSIPADSVTIQADPAWQMYQSLRALSAAAVEEPMRTYNTRIAELNRDYLRYRIIRDGKAAYYPDANMTLRLSYGTVKGIDPEGAAGYAFQTNIDQVLDKHEPGSHEFEAPEKLRQLHASKNYGRWAVNGTVPVNFVADNHTSGGNSGSPVLNAKGELIGTNFDRIWEGTMSDLYFDPNLCRNISVDIRYTLFIIEKFGGAGWLLNEMKIVRK